MKNRIVFWMLLSAVCLWFFSSCHSEKKKIIGVWQLNQMDVHGTSISGSSLGDWLWEFNQAGGYLTDIAGAKEKGQYKLEGNQLSLQPLKGKNRPALVYNILLLDSNKMELSAADSSTSTTLHFFKRNAEDVTEDKD